MVGGRRWGRGAGTSARPADEYALEHIGSYLLVSYTSITSLEGLGRLRFLGHVNINNNKKLVSLDGTALEMLETAKIQDNYALCDVNARRFVEEMGAHCSFCNRNDFNCTR